MNGQLLSLAGAIPAALALALSAAPASAQTKTTLIQSSYAGGPQKKLMVIVGDGFQANDQDDYNDYVDDAIMNGSFQEGPLMEDLSAFDIVRINANSTSEGVTQVDDNGDVTTTRYTAFDWRFSNTWSRCWMEKGPNTNARTNAILDDLDLSPDYLVVVLNEDGFGGCRRGSEIAVTTASGWPVVSHELGHMVGGLCDEYVAANPRTYTGGEPGCVNLTINTNRDTIKWKRFVRPTTPLPTTFDSSTMNRSQTVGAFEGGTRGAGNTFDEGIWRPASSSRMRSNSPPFNPVSYKRMKEVLEQHKRHTFRNTVVGDFNGDGFDDVVVHNENAIELHLANGDNVQRETVHTDLIGGATSWESRRRDRFVVGDFDGDGKDDLLVHNYSDWGPDYAAILRSTGTGFEAMRRWQRHLPSSSARPMKVGDRYLVADFDGDGRDDVYLVNTASGSTPYVAMYRSTGNNLALVRTYAGTLPGWTMRPGDWMAPADLNGDGKEELYVVNKGNWNTPYLLMVRSTGNALAFVRRYKATLPGWTMDGRDRFYVADVDGNGKDDLYVFNGHDWSKPYLKKLPSSGTGLLSGQRWYGSVPGWTMKSNDQWYVADVNGDGRDDLYVYNHSQWDSQYLGTIRSLASGGLQGRWQKDWVGSWNLGSVDRFLVGNFAGGAGWDDLFIRNDNWFGMLRSNSTRVNQVAIHHDWIHDTEYHSLGWW